MGKFRGTLLANVPAYYLIYIFDEKYTMPDNLREYIKANYADLKIEQKRTYTKQPLR